MPTYEYKCERCGRVFEKKHKMSEEIIPACPDCRGPGKKLISGGGGVIFKGSGFYATRNRGKAGDQETRKVDYSEK